MPGPKTANFLKLNDYQTFDRLVHELSECVLRDLVFIQVTSRILVILMTCTPNETIVHRAKVAPADSIIRKLYDDALLILRETRAFFWYSDSRTQEAYEKRWKPYNDKAWDVFFDEFVAFLTPRVQLLDKLSHDLASFNAVGGCMIRRDGQEKVWSIGQYNLCVPCERLKDLLSVTGFEAAVFSNKSEDIL